MLVYIGENLVGDVWFLDIEYLRTSHGKFLVSKIRVSKEKVDVEEGPWIFNDADEVIDLVAEESLDAETVREVVDELSEYEEIELTDEEIIRLVNEKIKTLVG